MNAPVELIELVTRFRDNLNSYKNPQYNETQVRREFIDPLFEFLGWDVANKYGYAEAYKEVIHEYSQKTKDSVEAPDYLFRIGGIRKFFVEAKKPSVNLKDDPNPAFQVRRYAWSAKLPLSILTDFEEFIVYDCRIKPNLNDKPSNGRILYFTFEDYLTKWDEIYSIFSREAVLKGSFDKFADSKRSKKGTAEVDDEFLTEIENWRELLAKNLALRNPELSSRELNFAVQKTIDRIIFLRICEDRGIEDYGQLLNLLNGANIYKRLLQIFSAADQKYNSGLFYFEQEKNRSDYPDTISHKLNIDDKTLKDIIKKLYYPESPYEFSVLPADILGHVYEQFLGKVIRLTAGHRAIVEEKPEVKKAGGVYYTPTYIVDYIVKNTLGVKLDDINSAQNKLKNKIDEASKLKILDPACGSGSFLLGAYQYLLDWHLKLYADEFSKNNFIPKKDSPVYKTGNNELKLTTAERKRILLNNIFGVDIDSQAVEVTKLSLMLKVLEGETGETLNSQLSMFRQRALPDLGNNIKCGNSLIGPDFYNQMEMNFLDDEEKYKINVFDWHSEFKEIFNSGGFDVVIGNPPYVRGSNLDVVSRNYFLISYKSAFKQYDIFVLFIEKSLNLIKNEALFGIIVSNKFLISDYGREIRKIILSNTKFVQAIDVSNDHVFKNASVYPYIIILKKQFEEKTRNSNLIEFKEDFLSDRSIHIIQKSFLKENYLLDFNLKEFPWIEKLEFNSVRLDSIVNITRGFRPPTENLINKADSDKKYLVGKDLIRAYSIYWSGNSVNYVTEQIAESKPLWLFEQPKIIFRDIGLKFNGYYDDENYLCLKTIYFMYLKEDYKIYNLKFLLALLNSKLFNFYFALKFSIAHIQGGYLRFRKQFVDLLPIKVIDENSAIHNKLSAQLTQLSDLMLKTNKELLSISTPQEKQTLQRQIEATDKQIDKLVYELYGLTEEEIKIVEES